MGCLLGCFTAAEALTAGEVTVLHAEGLPRHVVAGLKAIAAAAGDREISVASKTRTVRKQVDVIIDYYIECNAGDRITQQRRDSGRCNVETALRVYDSDCRGPIALYDREKGRADNVDRISNELTATLTALGPARSCMVHVELPGITLSNIAVDIAPSSVDDSSRFYDAVVADSSVVRRRFYYPEVPDRPRSQVPDSAFHLEFPRTPDD
jgi:hypothetical protein